MPHVASIQALQAQIEVPSASALDISQDGDSVTVTGTATINAILDMPLPYQLGTKKLLRFTGALTLTNSASLILPATGNITTSAGDTAWANWDDFGIWRLSPYTLANGTVLGVVPINKGGTGQTTAVAGGDALSVQSSDIASASTTNLAAATGWAVRVTGTTTITALGTANAGVLRTVTFAGILTLTHNATSLVLPTGADITTAAGDVAEFLSLGSGNWRCTSYTLANGQPIAIVSIPKGGTSKSATPTGIDAIRGGQKVQVISAGSIEVDLTIIDADYIIIDCTSAGGDVVIIGFGAPASGTPERLVWVKPPTGFKATISKNNAGAAGKLDTMVTKTGYSDILINDTFTGDLLSLWRWSGAVWKLICYRSAVGGSIPIYDPGTGVSFPAITEAWMLLTDVTLYNASSGKHGFVPKTPSDATKFLNGDLTAAYALVKDSDLSTSDITTNDVSTAKHGFAPKLPNDATKFLNGVGAYAVPSGGASAATQSDQETGTSTTTFTSPGRQQFHPSAAKAWVSFTTVTTTTAYASYNVSSLTDNGSGDTTINFTTAFSSANYGFSGCVGSSSGVAGVGYSLLAPYNAAPTASAFRLVTGTLNVGTSDVLYVGMTFFGDQ